MKNVLIIGSMLVVVCVGALAQPALKDQLTVTLTDPDLPGTVDINLVYGEIHVTGYAGKEVIIEASSPGRPIADSNTSGGKELKKVTKGNPLGLEAEEENNIVRIQTNSAAMAVNLTVKVPWKTSLNLRTYDKGDIRVDNVVGHMEVNNVKGSITLTNIGGAAVASTYTGKLWASLRSGELNKPMAFSSMGGQIDIQYPTTLKANIKVKSERGEVFSDFDMGRNTGANVKSSESGRNRVALDDWLYGKLNGGGPQIMVSNYLGNIYLSKNK